MVGAVVFTLAQLHPDLLFSNSTPTGGDMGAHVWAPAYLRDHLLPHFRLSGWAPDWYAGFPAYQFYMVIPALAVVILDVVLPYGLALRVDRGSAHTTRRRGPSAGSAGCASRRPRCSPHLVVFLFDETFTIYGGNIAPTMAGEFSFSIALSLSLVYFGVLAAVCAPAVTGRSRRACSHCACSSHLIVAIFAAAGTIVWFLLYLDRHRFKWLATASGRGVAHRVLGRAVLDAASLLTDMGYERRTDYVNLLFEHMEVGRHPRRARRDRLARRDRAPSADRHLARADDAHLRRVDHRLAAEHVLERAADALLLPVQVPPRGARCGGDRALARADRIAPVRSGREAAVIAIRRSSVRSS